MISVHCWLDDRILFTKIIFKIISPHLWRYASVRILFRTILSSKKVGFNFDGSRLQTRDVRLGCVNVTFVLENDEGYLLYTRY